MPTRRRKSFSSTHKTLIVCLVAASAAAVVAPRSWTAPLMNLMQWMVPVEDAVHVVAEAVEGDEAPGAAISLEECQAIADAGAVLERQTAALTTRIDELEREVRTLTATRLWDAGGRQLGSRGRLIPARVIGEDSAPWRSSRLLTAGTWQGVAPGQAVLDRGTDAAVRPGLAILLGQVLVGTIEQSATHTSRAQLISDVGTQMKVRIGRFAERRFALVERPFWLAGRGRGRMEIGDVDKRDTDAGTIKVGDVVLSDPQSETLPAALTIGRVASIIVDRDNPLFAILTVTSMIEEPSLDRVYIYDPTPEPP